MPYPTITRINSWPQTPLHNMHPLKANYPYSKNTYQSNINFNAMVLVIK